MSTIHNVFENPTDKIGRPLSGHTDVEIRHMALQLVLSKTSPGTVSKVVMKQADDYALYLVNGLEPEFKDEDSNLMKHAKLEMELAGVDEDIYGDMTSKAVLDLMRVFVQQGHSGMSGSLVLHLFTKLANFENLTPLTDNPDEWHQHQERNWQNKRNGACFSADGGKTYYNLNETPRDEEGRVVRDEEGNRVNIMHESVHVEPAEGVSNFATHEDQSEEVPLADRDTINASYESWIAFLGGFLPLLQEQKRVAREIHDDFHVWEAKIGREDIVVSDTEFELIHEFDKALHAAKIFDTDTTKENN